MDNVALIDMATYARNRAYAPYSNKLVGVALLTKSGKVYTSANVENAVYPLSVCAEHSAFIKAVFDGEREFSKIAIVSDTECMPCGACRQVMAEFCDKDFIVVTTDNGKINEYTLRDLLPNEFKLK